MGREGKTQRTLELGVVFFCLVILNAAEDFDSVTYIGHASGSTPGKHTVPRSEATALFHALATTRGNAVFVVDNYNVFSNYRKGPEYSPLANGLLWQALNKARKQRLEGGFGFPEVVWLKAHLSLEAAVNQGFPWQWWAVNWYADQLAKEAAQRHAVDSLLLEQLRIEDSIAQRILERNVSIAIALAPSKGQRAASEATSLTPKLTSSN